MHLTLSFPVNFPYCPCINIWWISVSWRVFGSVWVFEHLSASRSTFVRLGALFIYCQIAESDVYDRLHSWACFDTFDILCLGHFISIMLLFEYETVESLIDKSEL